MMESFERQYTYLQEIVDETLNLNRVKPETESMIDLLMEIYKDQPFASEFTIENVKAVVLNIVIAGTDTAAAAVVWGMTYLMKYPEVMKKAQAEVRGYVKERGLTFVSEDDVKNLPYFRALVKKNPKDRTSHTSLHPSCLHSRHQDRRLRHPRRDNGQRQCVGCVT